MRIQRTGRRAGASPGGRGLPAGLRRDLGALALACLGAIGFVALYERPASAPERALAAVLHALLGRLAPAPPAVAVLAAGWLALAWRAQGARARWAGAALGLTAACGAAHLSVPRPTAFAAAWQGRGGGLVGASVDWAVRTLLGPTGLWVVLAAAAVGSLLLMGQFSLRAAIGWPLRGAARGARGVGRALYEFVTEPVPAGAPEAAATGERPSEADVAALQPAGQPLPDGPRASDPEGEAAAPGVHGLLGHGGVRGDPGARGDPAEADAAPGPGSQADRAAPWGAQPRTPGTGSEAPATPQARPLPITAGLAYELPPLDLLRRPPRVRPPRGRDAAQRAAAVEEALRSFGVAARVVDVVQGPSVTRFEVQPGPGVKVARISSLADDLALALAATDVRIVAPIPGKAAVGIEVPNHDVTPVYLREVLESREFAASPSPLTVGLGQDIGGRPVVASLQDLFHLLVAGATGSGKSIALNAMLVSLLYKARPETLRLVLIDPKMVELVAYNGIPHLLAPVVTDPRKAAATLRTVVKEMEKRYALFTAAGARDLPRYNAIAAERGEPPLPYVVVVIDELADLMLVARSEVEDAIQRLTQMARAAGIHLIVATQRPSVDVITGVIKANIPSRIALTVSSQVDSRTILDAAGAEKLVGRGDMLFRPMGAQKLTRAQGAYVSEAEVEAVLRFLRESGRPEYDAAIMEAEPDEEPHGASGEDDDLFVQALQVVVESGQASVSNLQRRLRVGFTRAGRLVDMMEQRGFVGPHQGSKSREVKITPEQFRRLFGDRPRP